MRPTNKVIAATAAAALTTLVAYAIREFTKVDVPADVQGAFTVLVTALGGYFMPEGTA